MIKRQPKIQSENSDDFFERLQRHPQLRAKFEALLDVVENASGDVVKAHEAEERVFEELRQMGQDAIQAWSERKHQKLVAECDSRSDLSRKQKKALLADTLRQDSTPGTDL
jgi:asparagine synthetase B (glutamine-hydrolysing)